MQASSFQWSFPQYVNKLHSTDNCHNLLQYIVKLVVFNPEVNMGERKVGKISFLLKLVNY